MSGFIPNEIGKLHKLRVLNLSDNSLVQKIPVSIGKLTGLLELCLDNNELSGTLKHDDDDDNDDDDDGLW